jgi:glutamyl-tRNA synthetase
MGLKPKTAFAPFYVAVAGRRTGLPVNHLMALLGRNETLRRLGDGLEIARS